MTPMKIEDEVEDPVRQIRIYKALDDYIRGYAEENGIPRLKAEEEILQALTFEPQETGYQFLPRVLQLHMYMRWTGKTIKSTPQRPDLVTLYDLKPDDILIFKAVMVKREARPKSKEEVIR